MKWISLRGLTDGPDEANANRPYYVSERMKEGRWVWVDAWWRDGQFYLGTDEPKWLVKPSFLNIYSLLVNARDFTTLLKLTDIRCPHPFQWTGTPILTGFGKIITDTYIKGYETDTILLTDDPIYSELPLHAIVSDNINNLSNG